MNFIKKNLKTFSVLTFAVFAVAMTNMVATSWDVDKSHSAINFEVTHFFTPVNGQFNDYTAQVNFDPNNLEESMIDVQIMVNSIDTKNEKRDGHLKSADFFNASEYPMMTFKSTEIRSVGNNKFVAVGDLQIKDVSREIELPFTLLGVQDNPMAEGKLVAGITSEMMIDRTEFDVGVGDWASDAVIGDEVTVNLNLELHTEK
ncbi:YceI family protein [Balneola sp. MJW-20]|uniref:YceI family protein n=1 Tax=Gracilimonas aurantiaca TaxID=3234185 RepID=UPI00346510A5